MSEWWVSWYNDLSITEFEMHSPWWVSGYDASDNETMVAAVRADSEDSAKEQVRLSYDNPPADIRWRFVEPLERDTPFSDRFPQHGWMAWDDHGTCQCPNKHSRKKGTA